MQAPATRHVGPAAARRVAPAVGGEHVSGRRSRSAEVGGRRVVATGSSGVADDLQFGPAIYAAQDPIDTGEHHIFDEIVGTARTLENWETLHDDDGRFPDL